MSADHNFLDEDKDYARDYFIQVPCSKPSEYKIEKNLRTTPLYHLWYYTLIIIVIAVLSLGLYQINANRLLITLTPVVIAILMRIFRSMIA